MQQGSVAEAGTTRAPEVIVERPPPGLARGEYAWPAWAIATLGGTVVCLGIAYVVVRLWKRSRA